MTGQRLCKMTLGELGLPVLQDVDVRWVAIIVASINSVMTLCLAVYNALKHTKQQPRHRVIKGLFPLVLVSMMYWLIFGFTEWAWEHCGYVTLMAVPVVGLINSRQIVCNFTNQQVDILPKTPFWFILFAVNVLVPTYVPGCPYSAEQSSGNRLLVDEGYLALAVFTIVTVWYFHWAIGTIR